MRAHRASTVAFAPLRRYVSPDISPAVIDAFDTPSVIACNHRSVFDAIAGINVLGAMGHSARLISAPWLWEVPALGPVLDRIGAIPLPHGKAALDLLSDEGWAAHEREGTNPSAPMVRAMLDHGVRFILCGQSGAAYGVEAEQLVPGVETALSAMTAHALLQQRGYTVNPF